MYLVVQCGIYRHNIVGVTDSLDVAHQIANEAIAAEPDDYHAFDILTMPLSKRIEDATCVGSYMRCQGVASWHDDTNLLGK